MFVRGVCACVGIVKGTVLCADPRGRPYVRVPVCCWEYVPSCLHTGWTWGHDTGAASRLWGTGGILGREGSSRVPKPPRLVPLTVYSANLQPTTEHIHAERSCTGQFAEVKAIQLALGIAE